MSSKESTLRAWLREAIAEKEKETEAREGLSFDNLKLARRVAELTARLEQAERSAASFGSSFGTLLGWGDAPPAADGIGEELLAKVQENEYLQGALIDVQRSHAQTLRLQTARTGAAQHAATRRALRLPIAPLPRTEQIATSVGGSLKSLLESMPRT